MDAFWKRAERERRRQAVLDELMGLEPAARDARLDEAISTGDVKPHEKEAALRLVARLEAIRVMTVRPVEAYAPADPAPSTSLAADAESSDNGSQERRSYQARRRAGRRLAHARARARAHRSMGPAADRIVIALPIGHVEESAVGSMAVSTADEAWPSIEWLRP